MVKNLGIFGGRYLQVLSGTSNILKRVFLGTFVTQSVLLHLSLVLSKKTKNSKKSKMVKNLGIFGGRYLQVLPNTDRYFS